MNFLFSSPAAIGLLNDSLIPVKIFGVTRVESERMPGTTVIVARQQEMISNLTYPMAIAVPAD